MENCWMECFTRHNPLPIQINSCETWSVVPNNYSIWIETWDELEHKTLSQCLRNRICVRHENLEDTLENETWVSLSRMNSWTDHDSLPFLFGCRFASSESNDWNWKSWICQAHELSRVADIPNTDLLLAVPIRCVISRIIRIFLTVKAHKYSLEFKYLGDNPCEFERPWVSNINTVIAVGKI